MYEDIYNTYFRFYTFPMTAFNIHKNGWNDKKKKKEKTFQEIQSLFENRDLSSPL